MRGALLSLLLPITGWLAALQAASTRVTLEQSARLAGMAGVLGTLTVLIYRLGVWRQEMENTKHNVGSEVRAYREESAQSFRRIERRLEAVDRLIVAASRYRLRTAQWQAQTDRRLALLEQHNHAARR